MRAHINSDVAGVFTAIENIMNLRPELNAACLLICRRNVLFLGLRPELTGILVKCQPEGIPVVIIVIPDLFGACCPSCACRGVLPYCRRSARRHKAEVKASAERYYVRFCTIVIVLDFSEHAVLHVDKESAHRCQCIECVIPLKLDEVLPGDKLPVFQNLTLGAVLGNEILRAAV